MAGVLSRRSNDEASVGLSRSMIPSGRLGAGQGSRRCRSLQMASPHAIACGPPSFRWRAVLAGSHVRVARRQVTLRAFIGRHPVHRVSASGTVFEVERRGRGGGSCGNPRGRTRVRNCRGGRTAARVFNPGWLGGRFGELGTVRVSEGSPARVGTKRPRLAASLAPGRPVLFAGVATRNLAGGLPPVVTLIGAVRDGKDAWAWRHPDDSSRSKTR